MKIRGLKVIHCDAGWRPWTFLKIETDDGTEGWSECSESNGSPRGIAAVLADFEPGLARVRPARSRASLLAPLFPHATERGRGGAEGDRGGGERLAGYQGQVARRAR